MSVIDEFFQAERELVKEYTEKNAEVFSQGENGSLSRMHQLIVNPFVFGMVQGASMLYCIKANRSSNKLLGLTKMIGLTVLNANVFLYSFKHINNQSGSYQLFRSFVNPLFTLQKDKVLLSLLSIGSSSLRRIGPQSTEDKIKPSEQPIKKKLIEGFL